MFKNTSRLSPVVNEGLPNLHPDSFEYRQWWQQQRDRCIDGYKYNGISITGRHYFYLNFWKIRGVNDTGRKTLIPPRFTDLDYDYFREVDRAIATGTNLLVGKARQKGFSEKNACLMGYEYTLFPHSQSVVISYEDKYNVNTMKMCIRGLNELRNTEFYKRRNPDSPGYIQAKYRIITDGKPVWGGSFAEVYSITARNNPQAASGLSPSLLIIEEAGMFPGLIETYKYIQPMMEAEGKKTGLVVIVGTGGDMDGGAEELCKMFYNPDAYDLLTFDNNYDDDQNPEMLRTRDDLKKIAYFVPAWRYRITDTDGNSLRDESMGDILKKRERARKSDKADGYYTEVTQNPLNPSEMFMITGKNIFNRDKLYHRLHQLRTSRILSNLCQRGDLNWVRDTNGTVTDVEWKVNESGEFMVWEHPVWRSGEQAPKMNNLYFGSTDSYDRDEAPTSTSKLSSQIFKGILDTNTESLKFVARYTSRPRTAEEAYEKSALLMFYYNAMNLIEYSNLGIFKWYRDHGFEWMLRERPRVVYENIKDSRVNNRYGVDPATKPLWITYYRDYIEEHVDKMYDMEQIESAIKFQDRKGYNCDITISSSLAIVHYKDDIKLKATVKEVKPFEFSRYITKNGRITLAFAS